MASKEHHKLKGNTKNIFQLFGPNIIYQEVFTQKISNTLNLSPDDNGQISGHF
jgi:hypothetical protein